MKFSAKEYGIIKTKNYIKNVNLFFFFNGINLNSGDWVTIEQKLKKINFSYYKILNKTSKKTLQNSIYSNSSAIVNGITFTLKPVQPINELTKYSLINNFEPLLFTLLAIKLNNKVYSKKQLNNQFTFHYRDSKLLFFKFGLANIKFFTQNSK